MPEKSECKNYGQEQRPKFFFGRKDRGGLSERHVQKVPGQDGGEAEEALKKSMMMMMVKVMKMMKMRGWLGSDDVNNEVTPGGSHPPAEGELTWEKMGLGLMILLLF